MAGWSRGTMLGAAALLLCLIQWHWLTWRFSLRYRALERQIQTLCQDVSRLQRPPRPEPPMPPNGDSLQGALRHLGDRNLLERYRAGLAVQEYGEQALPELLDLVRTGNHRARDSALVLLADLDSPAALPPLRDIAESLVGDQAGSESDHKTLAAILGILARAKDSASLPLFEQAIQNPAQPVRTAALVGLRRLNAISALPGLIDRLSDESGLSARELERTISSLCEVNPAAFGESLLESTPTGRFSVVELLGRTPSAAATEALRRLTRDPDPRVALGAAHMLAKRGDASGREVAHRLVHDSHNRDLQRLAEEVLRALE